MGIGHLPEGLLEQAQHLARREPKRPRQASLRRAISTAYYALFHLLISEAILSWKRVEDRDDLARMFEHTNMKTACANKRDELNGEFKKIKKTASAAHELTVKKHFISSPKPSSRCTSSAKMPITTTQLLGREQMSSLRSLPWTPPSNPGRPFARRTSPKPFSSRSSKRNVDEGAPSKAQSQSIERV